MTDKSELEDMTYDELADLASEEKIKGRSYMDKAELVDALADKEAKDAPSKATSTPKVEKPKKSATPKASTSDKKYKDLLEEVAEELDRPTFNGHYRGCPAGSNYGKACACKAKENEALKRKVEDAL